MQKRPKYYSPSFKTKVVKDVLEGKYSKEEARRIHGIRSKSAVLYWIRDFYGIKNYRQPSEFEVAVKAQKEKISKEELTKIERLEAELIREKQRSALWKKMVEIAEEELGVEIRKKFGARQSSNTKKKAKKR